MTSSLTEKTSKTWVLLLTSAASFMSILDAMVVTTALGAIRQDLGASIELLEWTVNAYNLSFAVLLLTGAALGDRLGRRRIFIGGVGLVRPWPRCGLAHRWSRAPGRWCRAADAACHGAVERGVPAGGARQGARHLRRVQRHCAHHRADHRRRGGRGPRLAMDLLDQPPDRPRAGPARPPLHSRERRRPGRDRRAGRPARHGRGTRADLGPHARQPSRLDARRGR